LIKIIYLPTRLYRAKIKLFIQRS